MAWYRPGHRCRLIYRLHCYRGRWGETKALTWTGYRDILIAAHRRLPGGNIALIWDDLNVHKPGELRALTGARPWLRVYRLPACAPGLSPVEGIWPVLKRGVLVATWRAVSARGMSSSGSGCTRPGHPGRARFSSRPTRCGGTGCRRSPMRSRRLARRSVGTSPTGLSLVAVT